ncbi:hypothetical protein F5J12DRAFT_377485 [Pisolithus orientalis]|uniref:uncharacterized protein n=1 Tax=Pisolithus orientalis TaxID=936130 RepID=UPI002224F640|nr:uncharacterized protein F5J12DRAFT_377485 [Pisolithus orientalis]KAI6028395.1 hypothetical protein F5J12DRAFT_377485 [Pisolithus orientalis]
MVACMLRARTVGHSVRPLSLPTSLRLRRGLLSQNNGKESPPPPPPQDGPHSSMFIQDQLSYSAVFALGFFKRFAKLSILGIFTLGLTGIAAFEGAHIWVENVELATDNDTETKRWEWDCDAEKWAGGDAGGTDPALGFKGRHAVRAAWMSENWGSGSRTGVIKHTDSLSPGRLNIIEARLGYAEEFLTLALEIAGDVIPTGKMHPRTLAELTTRHADVLERMGTRDAIFDARSDYENLWFGLSREGAKNFRVALKLGDLNFRLGENKDALEWWTRTINMTQGTQQLEGSALPAVSQTLPSSPSAQRTLVSTLVSLSGYYSTSHHLKEAQKIQEAALSLLRSTPIPSSASPTTPPHLLHLLYMLHRSSLISIHLAEVLYASHSSRESSLSYLSEAAKSAERVVLGLSGKAARSSSQGTVNSEIPPHGISLLPAFTKSNVMRRPAKALLRDARRTATEAWNLMGILSEGDDVSDMRKALDCYERAMAWAGVSAATLEGSQGSEESMPEAEWRKLWGNYVRARDAVSEQGRNVQSN